MTEPTNKELDAVITHYRTRIYPQDMHPHFERAIMREALAKWGTPAPVGVEPVGEVGSMPGTDGFTMACFKASDVPIGTKLYTAEVLAMGRVPLTDEMASKAGRALSDLYATECGIDKEDNWKVYGSDFIDTARLVLEAAGIKGGQHVE